jgi:hypothetical protein
LVFLLFSSFVKGIVLFNYYKIIIKFKKLSAHELYAPPHGRRLSTLDGACDISWWLKLPINRVKLLRPISSGAARVINGWVVCHPWFFFLLLFSLLPQNIQIGLFYFLYLCFSPSFDFLFLSLTL